MTSLQTDQTQIKLEFIEKQEKMALRHFPTEDQKLQCSKNQSSGPRACWTECQKLCEFFEKSNRRPTDEGKVAGSELFRGHENSALKEKAQNVHVAPRFFIWPNFVATKYILILSSITAVIWVVRVV